MSGWTNPIVLASATALLFAFAPQNARADMTLPVVASLTERVKNNDGRNYSPKMRFAQTSCGTPRPTTCHDCACNTFNVCGPNNTNCKKETICVWQKRVVCN